MTPPRLLPVLGRAISKPHLGSTEAPDSRVEAAAALGAVARAQAPDSRLPLGGTSEAVAMEVGGCLRERRKEVALGRLRTLATLLILGAWGAATDGAPPDDATTPAGAARPPAPVAPIKYLEAGAKLFNNGQYPLAAKYLSAAQMYRDQLKASEQTVLDAYLSEMAKVPGEGTAAAPGGTAAAPGGTAPPVEAGAGAAG